MEKDTATLYKEKRQRILNEFEGMSNYNAQFLLDDIKEQLRYAKISVPNLLAKEA